MVEKELEVVIRIGKKLKNILDDILTTGDWDSSLFLKTTASKLQNLRDKTEKLCQLGEVKSPDVSQDLTVRKEVQSGHSRVFILLYQVDGANLDGWYSVIKTLSEYSVTRPAYKDESHAQELIRAKTSNVDRNGYVVVDVKADDFYQVEQQLDLFGHPLVALKENAIKLENIIEFVHSNKKRYAVRNDTLVFLGEI